MKKISKVLSAVTLSAALTLSLAGAAFGDVVFQSRAVNITGAGEYTATDLFDGFKGVMPGDELDQPVTVENGSEMTVKVYLRAEAHDEASNPLTYDEPYEEADGKDQGQDPDSGDLVGGEGQRDETVATMSDFLAQLTMIIKNGGSVIFSASPDQEAQLSSNVLLGELKPGESLSLNVNLSVPTEMGNEYASRVGEVDWVFTVEEVPEPLPDTGLSQTGDDMPVMLFAVAAAVAVGLVLVAAFALKRSKRYKGNSF